jgi:hypothetical protein
MAGILIENPRVRCPDEGTRSEDLRKIPKLFPPKEDVKSRRQHSKNTYELSGKE